MQITFLKELIITLKKKWSYTKDRYKFKKVNDFSLSQKIRFVYRNKLKAIKNTMGFLYLLIF